MNRVLLLFLGVYSCSMFAIKQGMCPSRSLPGYKGNCPYIMKDVHSIASRMGNNQNQFLYYIEESTACKHGGYFGVVHVDPQAWLKSNRSNNLLVPAVWKGLGSLKSDMMGHNVQDMQRTFVRTGIIAHVAQNAWKKLEERLTNDEKFEKDSITPLVQSGFISHAVQQYCKNQSKPDFLKGKLWKIGFVLSSYLRQSIFYKKEMSDHQQLAQLYGNQITTNLPLEHSFVKELVKDKFDQQRSKTFHLIQLLQNLDSLVTEELVTENNLTDEQVEQALRCIPESDVHDLHQELLNCSYVLKKIKPELSAKIDEALKSYRESNN